MAQWCDRFARVALVSHDLSRIRALLIDLGDTILNETTVDGVRVCTRAPELVPGAGEAIRELVKYYTLVIVRNADTGSERIWSALRHVGLADFFAAVVTSGEVGVRKPEPGIFLAALTKLGLQLEEVIMIGDQVEADIVGANRIGCKSILLRRNDYYPAELSTSERRPTYFASSWAEVVAFFKKEIDGP